MQRLILGEKDIYPTEEIYVRLDGSFINVEVMASIFTYNNKLAVQVIVTDITERKKVKKNFFFLAIMII